MQSVNKASRRNFTLQRCGLQRWITGLHWGNIAGSVGVVIFLLLNLTNAHASPALAMGNLLSLPYHVAFIASQGTGKNKVSAIVTTLSDGSQPTIRYQVQGNITGLTSGYDGKTLTFTQQQSGYPQIYALSLSANTLTLLTPYRANNIGGSLSADNKKLLFSSDLTQSILTQATLTQGTLSNNTSSNINIYLKDTQTQQITRLTHDPMIDITPMWAADGQSFIFSSDRSGINHPQIYRYDFASHRTQAITSGGYHVNGNLSQNGRFLTLLSSPRQGAVMDMVVGKIYPINNMGLDEAPSVSSDGQFLVYATGKALAVVTTRNLPDSQPRLIELPLNKIQQAMQKAIPALSQKSLNQDNAIHLLHIRHPVWNALDY